MIEVQRKETSRLFQTSRKPTYCELSLGFTVWYLKILELTSYYHNNEG